MSSSRTRAVALALLGALCCACRSGVGDNCVCKSDCRPGLVCAQNGSPITTECAHGDLNAAPAVCIEEDQGPDNATSLGDPPVYFDVGGKRDFSPPGADSSGAASSDGSGASSGTSASGSSSTTDASSSSGAGSSGSGSSSGATAGSSGT
ncbi:MAG: hypothetical protein K1X88_04625 [Nannocystaceae bacterium]|nr:hypothetical protein [Nannocystaceae bacterium]